MDNNNIATVVVLMSTYNGELYLEDQLLSLKNQVSKLVNGKEISIQILVRDDGSTDKTQDILDKWQKNGCLTWYTGPNLGPAHSFMHLLNNAPSADYYAFCDQDDVWLPEKISTAVQRLEQSVGLPALYVSTYSLVDKDLNPIKQRTPNKHTYTFGESFITNPATGCTLVFNNYLKEIVCGYSPSFIVMHDGWVYRIALAIGANIHHDNVPHILYRQHGHNVVGGKKSLITRWKNRFTRFYSGKCVRWHSALELYKGFKDRMNEKNLGIVVDCVNYKDSIWKALKFLRHKELKTPTLSFQIIFYFVVLLRKY